MRMLYEQVIVDDFKQKQERVEFKPHSDGTWLSALIIGLFPASLTLTLAWALHTLQ